MLEAMKLTNRCYKFFGKHPGETMKEFADEMRALTDTDKDELVTLFNDAGMPTTL